MLPNDITPSDDVLLKTRAAIADFGRMLFERKLTDAAGGNISVRVGNRICISPRYAGQQKQWRLMPEDVLVADLDRNVLAGSGALSRETHVHFSLLNEFHEHGTAVVHAHPRNLLVFATLERPLPPVLEATRKFGVTPVTPFAPAHSETLARHMVNAIRGREAAIRKHAAAAIAPFHGVFCIGKDLAATFDAVERLDNNAYIIMMGAQLAGADAMSAALTRMEDVVGNYAE